MGSTEWFCVGLFAVLTCVEPCSSFEVFRNRDAKRLELVSRPRKGLALYHYLIDPVFGFMNARIQSWLPFTIQVCINGREWLARSMDKLRLSCQRRDNCFTQLSNIKKAQSLMNQQLRFAWTKALDKFAQSLESCPLSDVQRASPRLLLVRPPKRMGH